MVNVERNSPIYTRLVETLHLTNLTIQKIIKQLASNGIGILITDHSVRETLGICDQAYIVNQGEIFAQGTPKVIAQNQSVKDIYLGENFIL